jgi:putative endopeptidase
MKRNQLHFLVLIVAFTASQCKSGKSDSSKPDIITNTNNVVKPDVVATVNVEPEYSYNSVKESVDFQFMDPSVDPKVDFYNYANGIWMKENPVPSTEDRWTNFSTLLKNNNDRLLEILTDASKMKNEPGTVNQLIGDMYHSIMDSTTRNKAGVTPLKPHLDKISGLKDIKKLADISGDLHSKGVRFLFDVSIDQDLKNNTRNMIYIGQGGMSLPTKDFYTKTDSSSVAIRTEFKKHVSLLFQEIGYDEKKANATAETVLKIETELASAAMDPVQMRDIEKQYNLWSFADLKKKNPSFNWEVYFKSQGMTKMPDTVIISQTDFMAKMESMTTSVKVEDWKEYIRWHLLQSTSSKLTDKMEKQMFYFNNTILRGTKKMKPRWERAVNTMGNLAINEALGHAFVDRTFSEDSKKKVNEMLDNIKEAFKGRLDQLDWMSDETKKKALLKLESFVSKIGFPDSWTDYSSLKIRRESYVENFFACNDFTTKKNYAKIGKPIDRSEWLMAPHIVNAYYNPLWNEIVFPAGIMQPPFFDVTKEDAVNYARMGAVIGHEFTHGFDDQGAMFDHTGTMAEWWTAEDKTKFNERAKKLVDHFNEFEPLPGLNVIGELTLGENIADLGGLTVAYYAYKRSLVGKKENNINGFTSEQRFFISFAQIWRENMTDKAMKMQVMTNPHSPGMYRVIGPLSNMPEFFEAFDVKEGDKMRRPADKICKIW